MGSVFEKKDVFSVNIWDTHVTYNSVDFGCCWCGKFLFVVFLYG